MSPRKIRLINDREFCDQVAGCLPGAIVRGVEPLVGGVSADTALVDVELPNGTLQQVVLRQHGSNHCGHEASLEFGLLAKLHQLGLPVPKPLAFDDGLRTGQNPYVLLQYIEGSTAIASDMVESCINAMAEALASIHDVDADQFSELPLRVDPRPELLEFLPKDSEWNDLRSILTRLPSTVFSGRAVLLHGDFWPQNIVWQSGSIAGVIDWEDAAIGDPISDVACAQLELRYLYGNRGALCFLNAYSALRPVDPLRLALWQAYVAAAGNLSMGNWGLEPSREREMRRIALDSIRQATERLAS